MGVELHHPITNDLERHPADLRRLRPARAFVNRGQRQKPPGLRPILRPPRGGPHHPRIKISPKWKWPGEPPAPATLNQTHADSGSSPSESRLLSFGITAAIRSPSVCRTAASCDGRFSNLAPALTRGTAFVRNDWLSVRKEALVLDAARRARVTQPPHRLWSIRGSSW